MTGTIASLLRATLLAVCLLAVSKPAAARERDGCKTWDKQARKCLKPAQAGTTCVKWLEDAFNTNVENCVTFQQAEPRVARKVTVEAPDGTLVRFYGLELCITPYCVDIPMGPIGRARLEAARPGYQSKYFEVGVEQGWQRVFRAEDFERCPTFRLAHTDADTSLTIDGVDVGLASALPQDDASLAVTVAEALDRESFQGCALSQREYVFGFNRPGYVSAEVSVTLSRGRNGPAIVEQPSLVRNSGTIVVVSAVGNVDVLLDGRAVATLPTAGDRDLVLEIPDVSTTVEHVVALRMSEQLSEYEQWGTFRHEARSVVASVAKRTFVRFGPPQDWVGHNPVDFVADRRQLDDLCSSDTRACVALGWAWRWGVGGAANNQEAAEAFARGCKAADPRRSMQACTAYTWLLKTGLAAPVAGGPSLPTFQCAPSATFPGDTVTPCVRARLNAEAQRTLDPTAHVEHSPRGFRSGRFLLTTGFEWGARQRFAWLGVGFSIAYDSVAVDAIVFGGPASTLTWNPAYTRERFRWTTTFGSELGPTLRLWPHFYLPIHLGSEFDTHGKAAFRVRAALGYTSGSATRHGFFVDLGATYLVGTLGVPTDDEIVRDTLDQQDLKLLQGAWDRRKKTASWLTLSSSIGYAF